MSIKNVVLIAGVHGVSGRTAAEHFRFDLTIGQRLGREVAHLVIETS